MIFSKLTKLQARFLSEGVIEQNIPPQDHRAPPSGYELSLKQLNLDSELFLMQHDSLFVSTRKKTQAPPHRLFKHHSKQLLAVK